MKKNVKLCLIVFSIFLLTGCNSQIREKISGLVNNFNAAGFKTKILTATKSGKAKKLIKKGEKASDFVKYQYSIELEKDKIKKNIIIRIFTDADIDRNYYNLKKAVSQAPNSYFVLKNGNMVMTMFSFDIEKERKILTEIAEIFKKYKEENSDK